MVIHLKILYICRYIKIPDKWNVDYLGFGLNMHLMYELTYNNIKILNFSSADRIEEKDEIREQQRIIKLLIEKQIIRVVCVLEEKI